MSKRRRFDSDDDEDDVYVTVKTELNPYACSDGINWLEDDDELSTLMVSSDQCITKPPSPPQESPSSSFPLNPQFGSLANELKNSSTRTIIGSRNSSVRKSPEKLAFSSPSIDPNATTVVGTALPSPSTSSSFPLRAFVQPCDKDIPQEYFSVLSTSVALRSYWTTLQYLFSNVVEKSAEGTHTGNNKGRADFSEASVLAQYVPSTYCTTQAAASLPGMEDIEARPPPGWRWDGVIRGRRRKS